MKVLYKFIPLFSLFFIFCSSKTTNELNGDWLAVHIFINGEEILDNNFEETGWFPKYYKTKPFYIMSSYKALNLQLEDHGKNQISAKFDFEKNKEGEEIFKIYNSKDKRFNGNYKYSIEKDTVNQEGVKTAYYFLTLESENTKIMAVRNKALFK